MTTPQLSESLGGEAAVQRTFEAVTQLLLVQGRVEIDGFGRFELHERKARRGRNPRTGDPIAIPAKVVVKFTPAPVLKRQAAKTSDAPTGS